MANRTLLSRLLSPTGLALVLLTFLLPFLAVSCETPQEDFRFEATYTGTDLVIGGDPEVVTTVDPARFAGHLPAQPLAIIAVIALLLAAAATLLREPLLRHATSLGLAVLAAATLVAGQAQATAAIAAANAKTLRELAGGDVPSQDYIHSRYGFWLAFYLLFALILGHGVAGFLAWRRAHPSPGDRDEVQRDEGEPAGPAEETGLDGLWADQGR